MAGFLLEVCAHSKVKKPCSELIEAKALTQRHREHRGPQRFVCSPGIHQVHAGKISTAGKKLTIFEFLLLNFEFLLPA